MKTEMMFICSIIPDIKANRNISFSRAGNCAVENILFESIKYFDRVFVESIRPLKANKKPFLNKKHFYIYKNIKIEDIPYINVSLIKQISTGLYIFYRIIKWKILSRGQKYILSYNISMPPGIFSFLAAKITGIPIYGIIFDINIPGRTVKNKLSYQIDYYQHKVLLKYYNIICINDNIKNDFNLNENNYIKIEGGISEARISVIQNDKCSYGIKKDFFCIGLFGSLDNYNSIEEIISALSQIINESVILYIAGKGPMESYVKLSALRDKRIKYLGFIDQTALDKIYSEMDILLNIRKIKNNKTRYLFPSRIFEYLASGKPIISTSLVGNMEYNNKMSIVIDEDIESIKNAIINVIGNYDEYYQKSQRNKQFIYSKTWENQFYKIYRFINKNDVMHGLKK